jgi:alpha-L-fucosidase
MTTTDIQKFRNMVPANAIYKVFADNCQIYFAGPVKDYVAIWDDTNEAFYQLRPNVSAYSQVGSPIEISIIPYENIQQLVLQTNAKETIDFLKARGFTDEEVNTYYNRLTLISGGGLVNSTHVQENVGYGDGYVPKQQ